MTDVESKQDSGNNSQAVGQTDLLKFLLEQKVISSAQFSVAEADMAMSGLNAEDVVLARRWLSEEKLEQVAPWLKKVLSNQTEAATATAPTDASTYQKNLFEYRRLVADALGEI
ncbi:MAG: hypothetical protein P4L53_13865 [Candidatus Obscuribacterales bacterium]|nr:hypothetical protein [Candidatus Obscuribacterales bacterium]